MARNLVKTFALEPKSCFLKVITVENSDIRVPTKTPTVGSEEDGETLPKLLILKRRRSESNR